MKSEMSLIFSLGVLRQQTLLALFFHSILHNKTTMMTIPTRKLMKHQTTKKMMVIVIKIQQAIVKDITNENQMRHLVVPRMIIRQNVQQISSHHIIGHSPYQDAMHVILQMVVVPLYYSIITPYAMLIASSR